MTSLRVPIPVKCGFCAALIVVMAVFKGAVAYAADVDFLGVIGNKALLAIDGAPPRSMSVGQSYNGIKLLAVEANSAKVEIDGRLHTLRIGKNAGGKVSDVTVALSRGATVTLIAEGYGKPFITHGLVNGKTARFIVDTGAENIVMDLGHAKSLGLDLSGARTSRYAHNNEKIWYVKLDTVTVGDITLHNIDAIVQEQGENRPFILLGMAFLKHVEMQVRGDTLVLKKTNDKSNGAIVTLSADNDGRFFTNGIINGLAEVRFLVDTGAEQIHMKLSHARELGLDLSKARASRYARTNEKILLLKLDTVTVGDIITLHNVDAIVEEEGINRPFIVLGMNFLKHMEVRHKDGTLTIKRRF